MTEIDYESRMRQAVMDLEKWGQEFAKYKPIAENLDDLKKTVLSEEMLKYQDEPQWKAEAKARVSQAYRLHLDGYRQATHKANVAWANLEAAKAKFDALRSLLSYEKKQLETFRE